MQRPIFIIRTFIFGVFLCSLNAQGDPFILDSSLSAVINQSLANDIQVADVNNDGYNDIIYSGYDSSRFGLFIDVYLSSNEGTISERIKEVSEDFGDNEPVMEIVEFLTQEKSRSICKPKNVS